MPYTVNITCFFVVVNINPFARDHIIKVLILGCIFWHIKAECVSNMDTILQNISIKNWAEVLVVGWGGVAFSYLKLCVESK